MGVAGCSPFGQAELILEELAIPAFYFAVPVFFVTSQPHLFLSILLVFGLILISQQLRGGNVVGKLD